MEIGFRVFLFAFKGVGEVRTVKVPWKEIASATSSEMAEIAERVFYWGQNDFQPLPMRSVSEGDIIEVCFFGHTRYFRVDDVGFTEVTGTFGKYLKQKEADEKWAKTQGGN